MTDRERDVARWRAKMPVFQLLGLFGLNPYQNALENEYASIRDQQQRWLMDTTKRSTAGLDQLIGQLLTPQNSLYNVAASKSLGAGTSALSAMAGAAGIAGSGLQGRAAGQLTSDVLAKLSEQIQQDRLARLGLAGQFFGQQANLAQGTEALFSQNEETWRKYNSSGDFTQGLVAIAKLFAAM